MSVASAQMRLDNWFVRNVQGLTVALGIVFGLFWIIDGAFKFKPGFVDAFSSSIAGAGPGQPQWLQPWFAFWATTVSGHPAAFVYPVGILELAVGFALVTGFMKKVAYGGGYVLSLFIWAIPEGFGGPYGPGSTDIGTGVVYAIAFLMLMVLNAAFGPNRFSLDAFIERRWPRWARIAEIRQPGPA